jgi:hypothetical protein
MSTEQTRDELIAKACEHKLYYKDIDPSLKEECEFLSCEEEAALYIDGFCVCTKHGFRLIQCLTEKLKTDTVEPDNNEE